MNTAVKGLYRTTSKKKNSKYVMAYVMTDYMQ